MTSPGPGQGKGARAAARAKRERRWEYQAEDDWFVNIVVTDGDGGTLHYRVPRQPFGFASTAKQD